jgi:hypothetical protein
MNIELYEVFSLCSKSVKQKAIHPFSCLARGVDVSLNIRQIIKRINRWTENAKMKEMDVSFTLVVLYIYIYKTHK